MLTAISAFLLQLVAHAPETRLLVWTAVLASPLLAWLVSVVLVGSGTAPRVGRAAIPVGVGAVGVLVWPLLVRLGALFDARLAGGPLGWLQQLQPGTAWRPTHAVLGSAITSTAVLVLGAALAALREPRQGKPFRVPYADAVGALMLGAAAIGAALGDEPYRLSAFPPLLDLAGAAPVALAALAVWTRAERWAAKAEAKPAPTVVTAALAPLDVPALWRSLGAIEPTAKPLATTPGASGKPGQRSDPVGQPWAEQAWAEVGGVGPAPRALEELAATWSKPGQAWLVGDLPDPTESTLLAALGLLAIRRDGLTLLVVSEEPAALQAAVAAAFARTGRWASGQLLVGQAAAREALAAGRVPAAIFVDAAELSAELLRALSGTEAGPLWAAKVDLVLLAGPDRGSPLAVTHRAFTLRRLALALRAAGARWSVVATGLGGLGGRATLEACLPGLEVHEVHYGARASAPVRAWRATEPFRAAPGGPWVRRALEGVLSRGLPAAVGDPTGTVEAGAARVWGGSLRFAREDTLDGVASASAYDDAWLLAAYRALPNRAPLPDGRPHDALWGLGAGGVTRFLLRDGNLEGLARTGQLPSPRPLLGYQNRLLQQAHLLAALGEGAQDVESLCGMFDRALVEHAVGGKAPARHALRHIPGREGLARTALAPRAAHATNPLKATVTDQAIRVVNAQGGEVLEEVDAQLAPTRFYPGRVFARGERRFTVPLHSLDAARGELRVTPVAADHPLTRPELTIRVEAPVQVQATQEVRDGRLLYWLGTFEVTAVEEVSGYRQVGKGMVVRNAPVQARYRTRARAVLFPPAPEATLFHLARSVDQVLIGQLLAGDEDLEVFPVRAGLAEGLGPGVVVVDRYVQGMGAAEALEPVQVGEVLKWVRAILQSCRCGQGCAECTPVEVLEAGPDKGGVLRVLGA